MGMLRESASGCCFVLKSLHVLGRDPTVADTVLTQPLCSRLQCILRYQNKQWSVVDKSKNGIFINGKLVTNRIKYLDLDDEISFPGGKNTWRLVDAKPPQPFLVKNKFQDYLELSSINVLPNENNPECLISYQGGNWLLEKGEHASLLKAGDWVELDNQQWLFFSNDLMQETATHTFVEEIDVSLKLQFNISLNEENVKVISYFKEIKTDFGYKSHHQPLLYLARQRVYGEERHIPNCEQGWVATEVLLHELGLEANHLNILIYRLRKSFAEIGFQHVLIERRQGEIRLCGCDLTLHKGDERTNYTSTQLAAV